MKPRQQRQRRPRVTSTLSLANLATWQADTKLVTWAQQEGVFKLIYTVLVNERVRATQSASPLTENRLLGRVEGYEAAIGVIGALAEGALTPFQAPGEPTYPANDDAHETSND